MKFTVAIALCCAAQVFGLGLPNTLAPQGTFQTVPPWQYATTFQNILLNGGTNGFGSAPLSFVVPPTFSQSAKQYRRSVDWQNEAAYIPLNNYVLLSNADLSAVTPRSKVLAMGPTVRQLDVTGLGATVAHPALSTDSFNYNVLTSTFNAQSWSVAPGDSYAWTGASLDWNMIALSGYDQVLDVAWNTKLAGASQSVNGIVSGLFCLFSNGLIANTVQVCDSIVVPGPLLGQNSYPQRWLRTSPISDGLYFVKDTSLLGIVSVQNGAQWLASKNRKTHIAYGGFRPNHVLNSGCDRQNRLLPGDAPAFFGDCPP